MPPVPAPSVPPKISGPAPEESWVTELDRFDCILRASDSATSVLNQWISRKAEHPPVSLIARRAFGRPPSPSAALIRRLEVRQAGEIVYRRVRLTVGRHVLSDAVNWYVPHRLTSEMRATLEGTDTPFGTIIAPLSPRRETLNVERYWPASQGIPAGGPRLPGRLLRHDALIRDAQGLPLCEVSEIYTRNILL